MKRSTLTLSALLVAAGLIATAGSANAALISEAYNFGEGDTRSGVAGATRDAGFPASFIDGDQTYNNTDGYGWTGTNLSDVTLRIRSTPTYTVLSTSALDNAGAALRTFRVDLPDGIYDLTITVGDDGVSQTNTVVFAGDEFDGTTDNLDESASSSLPFVTATVNNNVVRGQGEHSPFTINDFVVDQGYVLIGFLAAANGDFGAINSLEINEVPEPGSLALLGLGSLCLLRRRTY